ncbi:protein wech-like [Zeugodacus cucurbitae]|uniref:protein wech-like n=1 Tax=Zeugodacus cucurbitae TaxID=28588 RepID=UPI0023D93491|nr:protein wech-like [Zeugodacus cucurbitae]
MQCSVFNCSNQTNNRKYQFFPFPKETKLRNKWLNFCHKGNEINLKLAIVCSKHFKPKQFLKNNKGEIVDLKPHEVPSITTSEKSRNNKMSGSKVSDSTMTPNIGNTSRYTQRCRVHNEILLYICEDCRALLCEHCLPENHAAHNCFEIDNFLNQRKDLIYHLTQCGNLASRCFENIGFEEVECSRNIDDNCNMLAQSIRNTFRPLIAALEQREHNLLEIVNKMHRNRMDVMYEQMSTLRASYTGLINSTNKLHRLFGNGPRLENFYIVTQVLEAQRQVDRFAQLYEGKHYKDEFYKFYPPQFSSNVLRNIETLGSIELDGQNDLTNIFNIPNGVQDVNSQNTFFTTFQANLNNEVEPNAETDTTNIFETQQNENSTNIGIGQAVPGFEMVKVLRSDLPTLTFAPKGTDDGHLGRPWGVCVNKVGQFLITDRRNHNVQIFGAKGQFMYKFGQKGSSNGQFNAPAGICVDKSGRIIIADKNNHRIQVFTSGGKYLLSFGSLGSECGNFKFPFDVSVNSNLQIAVTDSANHRIQQFEHNGRFIREIPLGICKFSGYEITPRGICYTPKGNLIVTDYANHCLHLIDPAKEKIIRTKGNRGFGTLQFSCPSGVCCDDDGTIVVADCHNRRICVFSSTLESLWNLDIRPSVNCLKNTYCDETDRTCDVALTKEGRIVFVTEMLPANEATYTTKRFVHVY